MWITCLDPVSANSEKGRRSEWAVRVGQRLQLRFGQSGAARELGLVQIVVEASAIRGGFLSHPVSGWRCRRVLGTGLNLLHGAKFQRFLSGKSVFLNSKFQIREFHAH